jgi:hypothetical protein|uniref:Uncharacterized protein n=1 Tax=viral metagenome TaxID=1070528 RepID=A0A6C0M2T7_9ZZZZ
MSIFFKNPFFPYAVMQFYAVIYYIIYHAKHFKTTNIHFLRKCRIFRCSRVEKILRNGQKKMSKNRIDETFLCKFDALLGKLRNFFAGFSCYHLWFDIFNTGKIKLAP